MIEKETTEEIMIQGQLWDNQRRKVNFYQSERQLNKVWVSMESLKEIIRNNSNPCMKCGSVQCAICSLDLIEELESEVGK